jgi:hypothetical protein
MPDNATLEQLAVTLGDVTRATAYRYGVKDDRGVTMDCLKILPLAPGDYLGVSHALLRTPTERFVLNLARSKDLLNWTYITTLDEHASQGELYRNPADGSILVAYEHDEPNSCFVRLRRYGNRAALEKGQFTREVTLKRTLAPTAEGTPSIERVTRDEIALRFHYYRNGDVDRAAKGVLRGWQDWRTEVDEGINRAVEAYGVRGNIGGRSRFTYAGQTYYVQEGQGGKNDWASWRVYLMEGAETNGVRKAVPIPMKTHGGSKSFANPHVTRLQEPGKPTRFFVSLFMPSEGSARGESGELVYIVNAPASR